MQPHFCSRLWAADKRTVFLAGNRQIRTSPEHSHKRARLGPSSSHQGCTQEPRCSLWSEVHLLLCLTGESRNEKKTWEILKKRDFTRQRLPIQPCHWPALRDTVSFLHKNSPFPPIYTFQTQHNTVRLKSKTLQRSLTDQGKWDNISGQAKITEEPLKLNLGCVKFEIEKDFSNSARFRILIWIQM